MSRSGRKASRPDDHGTIDNEREAAVARLTVFWERQSARIAKALDTKGAKSVPDVAGAFDHDAENAALTALLAGLMQRLGEVGAWDVLDRYGADPDAWTPELIEAYLAKAAETNAGRWTKAVEDGLADAVAGDPANAAERVKAFLDSNGLAVGLATAFAAGALSFGAYDAADKSGLSRKVWRTRGRNVRPSHAAQNGEEVGIRDVFSNGLRWPGDHFGTSAENANCKCQVEFLP